MRMTATKINGVKQKVSNYFFLFFFGKIEQNKTQSERVKIDKTKDATKMISEDKRIEGKYNRISLLMDLNRREFLFLLIDYLFLNKSNKILIYLFYDRGEFKLHLVKSYTFFKWVDLSRSNSLKKTFIITNILVKILLITHIYYILNLFLNPKTFDV